jgi:hypothetical protein
VAFELELIPTNSESNTKKYKDMKQSKWTGSSAPQSFVTKGKHRLKQNIDTVYLNDGDEFEIELYNPTQSKVLAKITLDDKSIGNGIVLRPGERVFLERHLDEARKFKFETYFVDGDNKEVEVAIKNNGNLIVKFYQETTLLWNTGTVTFANYPSTLTYTTNTGSGTYFNPGSTFTTSGFSGTGTVNTSYLSSSTLTSGNSFSNNTLKSKKSVETGRIEKGSLSDQSFTYDNTTFNYMATWSNWWKIKPQSTKILMKEDLVVYCTECGAKRKKDGHKFCPNCGTKY